MSGSRTARKEISEWLKGQADDIGDGSARLEIDHVKEEERRIVLKSAAGEAFSIMYQTDYPSSADEYLFIETESKVPNFVAVINDLRDYVYGQPTSLSLTALLNQLKRYLEKKSAKRGKDMAGLARGDASGEGAADRNAQGATLPTREGSPESKMDGGCGWSDSGDGGARSNFDDDRRGDDGDEEDDDEGNQSDYVYEDDDDEAVGGGCGAGEAGQIGSTWLDEHYKKRKWQSKERELRKEMAANQERKAKEDARNKKGTPTKKLLAVLNSADRNLALYKTCMTEGRLRNVENIFTSRASSAVLTQDLLDIQRLEQELGMEVEAVEDNIFHWKVKINRVSPASPLAEDLERLRKSYAYGYVEMELTFTMDLYPFYPPFVKLVRPRFQGFMMGRITSLEMLQLSKWSSVRGMKGTLLGIRTALETWGRLDLSSELNDVIVHPEGSYTELEHLLMRLGLVTEIRPHASEDYNEDALWEAVGMREEAEDKARRHWSREQAEGSSVERKRKRSCAAAAAAAAGSADPAADNAATDSSAAGSDDMSVDAASNPSLASHLNKKERKPLGGGGGRTTGSSAEAAGGFGSGTQAPASSSQAVKKVDLKVPPKIVEGAAGPKASGTVLKSVLSGLGGAGGVASGGSNAVKAGAGAGDATTPKPAVFEAKSTWAGSKGGPSSSGAGRGRAQDKRRQQYWAAGTGYGHSGAAGEKWDVEAYLAAQREQDRNKEDLLHEIAYLMRPDERHHFPEHASGESKNTSDKSSSSSSGEGGGGSKGVGSRSSGGNPETAIAAATSPNAELFRGRPLDVAGLAVKGKRRAAGGDAGAGPGAGEIYDSSGRRRKRLTYSQELYRVESVNSSLRVLEESCLVLFLQQLLENDSLLDVDRHASLYTSVFKFVKCITAWRSLHPLLCPMKGQAPGKSLYRLLSRLGDRAKVYRSTTAKGAAVKKTSIIRTDTNKQSIPPDDGDQGGLTDLLLSAVREVEEVVDASFVEELERASITRPGDARSSGFSSCGDDVSGPGSGGLGPLKGRGRGSRGRGRWMQKDGEAEQREDAEEEARRYRQSMAPLQYVELEDLSGFAYRSESNTTANRGNPQRVKRLGQEHADLSQSLPLSLSSSVFVRTHQDQMDWMQVIISGPDETPYSGGLFAFDIFFPHNYPQGPPKVKLMTTGGGHHRFNPNLYADGKVCLSLLGTWDGDKGENWNSQTSTLLQVLVSIQSLILVPEPFFNEPGYERQLGTEQGKSHSWEYNAKQREGTVRLAMLDMITRPPPGFEGVVNRHFALRRRFLERLVDGYVREAKERSGSSQHHSRMQGLASQLKEKLAGLPSPPLTGL